MFAFDVVLQKSAMFSVFSVQIVEMFNLSLFSRRVQLGGLVRSRAQVVVTPILHVLVLSYVFHFSTELVEVAVALVVCRRDVFCDDVPAR